MNLGHLSLRYLTASGFLICTTKHWISLIIFLINELFLTAVVNTRLVKWHRQGIIIIDFRNGLSDISINFEIPNIWAGRLSIMMLATYNLYWLIFSNISTDSIIHDLEFFNFQSPYFIIRDNVTKIGNYAFSNSSFLYILIPNSTHTHSVCSIL